jgi:hypothetical protein
VSTSNSAFRTVISARGVMKALISLRVNVASPTSNPTA